MAPQAQRGGRAVQSQHYEADGTIKLRGGGGKRGGARDHKSTTAPLIR